MAFGRITKKTFRKIDPNRRYRRKRGNTRNTNAVVSRTAAFPDRFITRLKYSEAAAIIYAGAGVPQLYSWRINSIFDPNLTGTGHQPLGHDEYLLLYNRYRCYGMKYTVTFTNRSTTEHAEVAIVCRPNSASMSNQETVRESPNCVYKRTLGVEGSGQAISTYTGYASVAKIRGVAKHNVQNENEYSAIMGNNPPITPTLQVYVFNPISSTGVTVDHRVDLEYYVAMYDRKILNQS